MISSETFMLLNMALSFGVPLALIWWELRRLRNWRDEPSGDDRDSADTPLAPAPTPVSDDDLPPLPDCVRPKPVRQRELV